MWSQIQKTVNWHMDTNMLFRVGRYANRQSHLFLTAVSLVFRYFPHLVPSNTKKSWSEEFYRSIAFEFECNDLLYFILFHHYIKYTDTPFRRKWITFRFIHFIFVISKFLFSYIGQQSALTPFCISRKWTHHYRWIEEIIN